MGLGEALALDGGSGDVVLERSNKLLNLVESDILDALILLG